MTAESTGPEVPADPRPGQQVPPADDEGPYRVVLDSYAFLKGWFIASMLWLAGLAAVILISDVVFAAETGSTDSYMPRILPMILLYGFGVALLVGIPLGALLAFLLRPVENQWLHVAAFFAAPTLVFWLLGGLLGLGFSFALLGLWSTVGLAAAIGRFAVRKNAPLLPQRAHPST